LYLNLKVKM